MKTPAAAKSSAKVRGSQSAAKTRPVAASTQSEALKQNAAPLSEEDKQKALARYAKEINCINKQTIAELKSLNAPPELV